MAAINRSSNALMKFKPVNIYDKMNSNRKIIGDRETVAGLLGTREPEKPAGTLNDILPVDLKLNYYEKKYAAKFKQLMRTMWAYSFFIVRVKYIYLRVSNLSKRNNNGHILIWICGIKA